MKCVILLALLGFAMAQVHNPGGNHHPDHNHHPDTLEADVKAEVEAILQADSTLTVDACTSKCDAEFALTDSHLEQQTDHFCAEECRRQIGN